MAQKAFAKKLREIEMSDFDVQVYDRFYKQVSREITTLRTILESVEGFVLPSFLFSKNTADISFILQPKKRTESGWQT